MRLLFARILSAMVLAALIGMALLVLFCLSLVPTYLLRGHDGRAPTPSSGGSWRCAIGRIAALTGLAAGAGRGRGEHRSAHHRRHRRRLRLPRGRRDGGARRSGPTGAAGSSARTPRCSSPPRTSKAPCSPVASPTAALTLCGYVAVLVAVALVLFRRRDLAGTS